MRKVTVKCDNCGFEETFNEDEIEPFTLKGWAYICPECAKSFFDVKELKEKKEVKEDD